MPSLEPAWRQAGSGTSLVRAPHDPRHTTLDTMTARLRRLTLRLSALAALLAGCASREEAPPSAAERAAVADSLRAMIVSAYDLTRPGDAVARMMSLYPDTGGVVSASGGRVSVSRDSLEAGIRAFWQYVGQNMRQPKWTWDSMHVDVLAHDAAVVTATYRVPHLTPRGQPHTIAGALTAAFQRRDGRWTVVQEHLSDLPQPPLADSAAGAGVPPAAEHRH
jgi:ketosteroid isomerase-like protein